MFISWNDFEGDSSLQFLSQTSAGRESSLGVGGWLCSTQMSAVDPNVFLQCVDGVAVLQRSENLAEARLAALRSFNWRWEHNGWLNLLLKRNLWRSHLSSRLSTYFDEFAWVTIVEWKTTEHHRVQHATHGPHVGLEWIVRNSLQDLRACVGVRSTVGFWQSHVFLFRLHRGRFMGCHGRSQPRWVIQRIRELLLAVLWWLSIALGEAKVDQFHHEILIEEDVLALDVPVADALRVAVIDASEDLAEVIAWASLGQPTFLVDQVENGSIFCVLHDNVQSMRSRSWASSWPQMKWRRTCAMTRCSGSTWWYFHASGTSPPWSRCRGTCEETRLERDISTQFSRRPCLYGSRRKQAEMSRTEDSSEFNG